MSTALASRRRVGLSSGRRTEMSGETSDHRGMCRGGVLDVLTWPLSSTRWGPGQTPLAPAISRSAEQRSLARSTGHPLPASRCRRAALRKRLTKGRP